MQIEKKCLSLLMVYNDVAQRDFILKEREI